MRIWQAIILGAIQGFTEFLPVSSSGHLLLIERWIGVNTGGGLFFDIMLHTGTLVPVFIVFNKSIKGLFVKPYKTLLYLIAATLPAALAGFLFQDKIEYLYKGGTLLSAILLAVSFLFTAIELFFAEKISQKNKNALPLSVKSSIIMGVFQGFAVIPGLSRSGTVITGGAFAKLENGKNAEFAFLMSIPVILGAAAVSGVKIVSRGATVETVPTLFGVITAAVSGYIAINVMLNAVKKAKYGRFSVYLILLAVASVLTKVLFGV
ncbi:MAG: undecaprenyl-diphosphate phosphatase [Clostridia bacterium]|nr:undecaprenyl-diphosphate phosphatase [Clostridia bacterium]